MRTTMTGRLRQDGGPAAIAVSPEWRLVLARAVIAAARLRGRIHRTRPPREDLVARFVAGRSFADIGCMWSVDGAIAFSAEDSGASAVTGADLMAASEKFQAEHARRGSKMRFVQGDLHDPATVEAVGVHDVVWCSGVIYHAPHPLLTLERLRELTADILILASETLPEVPGVPQACVFYPGLSDRERRAYAAAPGGAALGVTTPYDHERGYGNWYWGITPSALAAMTETAGFEVVERHTTPLHTTLVARVRP
jgi:2-polyprenyl-3-methyl-5-hydroxy-6-metoxy-1,4-benzoquinol methylase